MILVTILFLQPLVLVALYLYVSGAFTNRRAFQSVFYILFALVGLTIVIGGIQLSYQVYDLPTTTPVLLSEVLPDPETALQQTR